MPTTKSRQIHQSWGSDRGQKHNSLGFVCERRPQFPKHLQSTPSPHALPAYQWHPAPLPNPPPPAALEEGDADQEEVEEDMHGEDEGGGASSAPPPSSVFGAFSGRIGRKCLAGLWGK